jgi:hypothetical protein
MMSKGDQRQRTFHTAHLCSYLRRTFDMRKIPIHPIIFALGPIISELPIDRSFFSTTTQQFSFLDVTQEISPKNSTQ